jgi:chemotaxis protein methyltransferase CheR
MNVITTITTQELDDLIDLIKATHGFDFALYSKASLKRRVLRIMQNKKLSHDDLKRTLARDKTFFPEFLNEITVNVTEMFRDPTFYQALNKQVLPGLTGSDRIKIWSAGCSSGEEVYSLAILLDDAGLWSKSFIYGTDINTEMLNEAREGIYRLKKIKNYIENYQYSGLKGSLTDHFNISYDTAKVHDSLKKNTSFLIHNLVSDSAFNEFQMITCRNVFIYFETELQEKILELFYNSLAPYGFLCMGSKETIRSDKFKKKFKVINGKENIYQKIAHNS